MASVGHAPPKHVAGKLLSESESLQTRKSIRKLLLPTWRFTKKSLLMIPVPIVWWWELFQKNFAAGLSILLTAIAVAFFGSAGIARVVVPSKEMIVARFEISDATANALGMDGKSLTNIFVDELQTMIEKSDSFSGNSNSSHKMYSRLPDSPHIPVQTTFGIQIQGISLDQIIALWHRARYTQYLVSGDIVATIQPPKVVSLTGSSNLRPAKPGGGSPGSSTNPNIAYARYTQAEDARIFDQPVADVSPDGIKSALHELAVKILSALNPEIPIRYFERSAWDCDKEGCVIKNSQKALDLAAEWVKGDPRNARAFYFLGYALDHLSRPADAWVAFDKSTTLNPDLDLGWHGKGFCLLDQGLWEKSMVPMNTALAIRKSPFLENNLGLAFYNQDSKKNPGNFDEAITHYKRAIAIDPDFDDAYSNLGQALIHLGRNDDAIKEFQKARQLNVADYDNLAYLLIAMIKSRKPEVDIDNEANLASLLAPKAWEPHWVKGMIALQRHDPQTALVEFNVALEIQKTAKVWVEIARARRMGGDQEGAKSALEMALIVDRDDTYAQARAHHLLGVVLTGLGNPEEASYHLEHAKEVDPSAIIDFPEDE